MAQASLESGLTALLTSTQRTGPVLRSNNSDSNTNLHKDIPKQLPSLPAHKSSSLNETELQNADVPEKLKILGFSLSKRKKSHTVPQPSKESQTRRKFSLTSFIPRRTSSAPELRAPKTSMPSKQIESHSGDFIVHSSSPIALPPPSLEQASTIANSDKPTRGVRNKVFLIEGKLAVSLHYN